MGRSEASRSAEADPRPLTAAPCGAVVSSGITCGFPQLSLCQRHVTHVFLTLSPLYSLPEGNFRVRLACLNHAASVRSEPGSNSSVDLSFHPFRPKPKREWFENQSILTLSLAPAGPQNQGRQVVKLKILKGYVTRILSRPALASG